MPGNPRPRCGVGAKPVTMRQRRMRLGARFWISAGDKGRPKIPEQCHSASEKRVVRRTGFCRGNCVRSRLPRTNGQRIVGGDGLAVEIKSPLRSVERDRDMDPGIGRQRVWCVDLLLPARAIGGDGKAHGAGASRRRQEKITGRVVAKIEDALPAGPPFHFIQVIKVEHCPRNRQRGIPKWFGPLGLSTLPRNRSLVKPAPPCNAPL